MVRRLAVPLWAVLATLGCTPETPNHLRCPNSTGQPLRDGDSDYVFDDSVIRPFDVLVDPDDWAKIQADPEAEEYVRATVCYEGREYLNAAIRYKGGFGSLGTCVSGLRNCDKLNMKLKFSEYQDDLRFYGLKRINLHGMSWDDARLRENLSYRLFRDFDVPAPRTAYARLTINGEPRGLHLAVEQVDGQFARHRFADGGRGNVYKEIWFNWTDPRAWESGLRTNREENPDFSGMIDMARELNLSSDDTFKTVLGRWVDTDRLVRYRAVEETIGHWDGITGWYCFEGGCVNHNFYLYEPTNGGPVVLIAWDVDITFSTMYDMHNVLQELFLVPAWDELEPNCDPIQIYWGYSRASACDPFMGKLALTLRSEYLTATQDFVDQLFIEEALHTWVDENAALIATDIAEDPFGPTTDEWQAEIPKLKEVISGMRSRALDILSGP